MSKTKKAETSHYEILFIIPNKFTEDESKTVMDMVEKTITDNGGQITLSEYWGKKRLAYEIKHNTYGYYGLFEFDVAGELLAKIDQTLRLSADVLRHQIVIKKIKSQEEVDRDQKIQAKINSKKVEVDKKEKEVEKTKKTSSTRKEKKVDLKDLDEKLEGILNADDLI